LNADDEGTVDYAKIFTLLNQEQIAEMQKQITENPRERQAQKTLAREVTGLVHGAERVKGVEKVNAVLFGNSSIVELSDDELDMLAGEIPTVATGSSLVETLVGAEVASSNGDARRLIEGGAVSVNGGKVSEDFQITTTSLIKKGKNNFILVR
jgi:tyrosyl-tRNA synthetase